VKHQGTVELQGSRLNLCQRILQFNQLCLAALDIVAMEIPPGFGVLDALRRAGDLPFDAAVLAVQPGN